MKTIQIDNMTYIQDPVDHQFYRLSPEDARRPMSFKRAVKQCWEKYAIFDGRSRRSEYWWFCLFTILVILLPLAFSLLMLEAFDGVSQGMEMVGYVVAILMLILIVGVAIILMFPCLSVLTRRLHDVGRSGWWVFWDVVLSGASSLALSVAFSFTGIGESSIYFSNIEVLRAICDFSLPVFVPVLLIYLAHLGVSLTVLVFTLLDSHKGENRYGSSPKYPQPIAP